MTLSRQHRVSALLSIDLSCVPFGYLFPRICKAKMYLRIFIQFLRSLKQNHWIFQFLRAVSYTFYLGINSQNCISILPNDIPRIKEYSWYLRAPNFKSWAPLILGATHVSIYLLYTFCLIIHPQEHSISVISFFFFFFQFNPDFASQTNFRFLSRQKKGICVF